MIRKIIKPTSKQTIAAIKSHDFSEVDKIKENFTFAEHCNLDAEITALLMPKTL